MELEEITIQGAPFLVPAREQVIEHQCVCLLEQVRLAGTVEEITTTVLDGGLPEVVKVKDKCQQMVSNPDQPFCDDCEQAGHHLLNQLGTAEKK